MEKYPMIDIVFCRALFIAVDKWAVAAALSMVLVLSLG
jgi:hypothetical protein